MQNPETIKLKRHLEVGILGIISLFAGMLSLGAILLGPPLTQHFREFITILLILGFGFFLTFFAPSFTSFNLRSRKVHRWRGILPLFKREYDFSDIKNIEVKTSKKIFIRDSEFEGTIWPFYTGKTFEMVLKVGNDTLIISDYKLNQNEINEKMETIKKHLCL